MLGTIYRLIVDTVYMTPLAIKKYRNEHPDETVIVAGGCKGRMLSNDEDVKSGIGWVFARRRNLILTDKRLTCGDWDIPSKEIREATLLRINSFFARAYILKVSTNDGKHFQFGLQYNPKWETQSQFSFSTEDSKIKMSVFSVCLRILILIWIIWYFIQQFNKK